MNENQKHIDFLEKIKKHTKIKTRYYPDNFPTHLVEDLFEEIDNLPYLVYNNSIEFAKDIKMLYDLFDKLGDSTISTVRSILFKKYIKKIKTDF